jgi:hypothetical protein
MRESGWEKLPRQPIRSLDPTPPIKTYCLRARRFFSPFKKLQESVAVLSVACVWV